MKLSISYCLIEKRIANRKCQLLILICEKSQTIIIYMYTFAASVVLRIHLELKNVVNVILVISDLSVESDKANNL